MALNSIFLLDFQDGIYKTQSNLWRVGQVWFRHPMAFHFGGQVNLSDKFDFWVIRKSPHLFKLVRRTLTAFSLRVGTSAHPTIDQILYASIE